MLMPQLLVIALIMDVMKLQPAAVDTGRKQEVFLPLLVSIHQDPNQDPRHSHQDGVVIHTFQSCNKTEPDQIRSNRAIIGDGVNQ